jgi:branched-chain amino acid transport system permease protein
LTAIAFTILSLLPSFLAGYYLAFLMIVFMHITLAEGFNMFSGYSGYVCLGYAAFFGIGAYVTSLLTLLGAPIHICMIVSAIAGVALATPIGLISLRLRGAYFLISTFALSEVLKEIFYNWKAVGGAYGLTIPSLYDYRTLYLIMLLMATTAVVSTYMLEKSRVGLYLVAIRESEEAAESLGVDTFKYKLLGFIISCIFPSIFGGLYALWMTYIDPSTVFNPLISFEMVIQTFFGGRGTVMGPVIGAVLLSTLSEVLWARFPYIYLSIYGAILISVVMFIPGGLMSVLRPGIKGGLRFAAA